MNAKSLLAASALLVGLVSLTACGKKSPAESTVKPLRVVDAVAPQAEQSAPDIELTGVIAFREEQRAGFKTGGVVARVAVREGDVVQRGQLLAELNGTEIDASVAQAQALHEKAERDLKRGQALFAQEVIPQETLDNLKTAERAARAGLQAVQFNQGTASLRASEPVVVIKRLAEAGEVVGAGQPVLLLGSLQSGLVFRAGVNDAQRVRLDPKSQAQVMLDAWPGHRFAATVQEVGQVADSRTGAFRLELAMKPERDKPFFAGMVGRAHVSGIARTETVYRLPLSAVLDINKTDVAVYAVAADNSVVRQTLQLAELTKDSVLVRGPLPAPGRYVASGTSFLTDGEKVRLTGEPAASNAGAPQ